MVSQGSLGKTLSSVLPNFFKAFVYPGCCVCGYLIMLSIAIHVREIAAVGLCFAKITACPKYFGSGVPFSDPHYLHVK